MKEYSVYLAGGMTKFGKDGFEEANEWRVYCQSVLKHFESDYKVRVINPNTYFSFNEEPPRYESQREIMELDLNKVRNSDLIIINFNDVYSLGSMAELAIAYERRIPVVGLNTNNHKLHAWQVEMCTRIFEDIDEMLDYVEDMYLT